MDDYSFALCLTHDVDRPKKSWLQSLYYAACERDPRHLTTLTPSRNPYWQFDRVMSMEADLGVRSAFYFLDEPHLLREKPPREWLDWQHLVQHLGRYDLYDPAIVEVVRRLDEGGWEVGLHGSYGSYDCPDRLAGEKALLERILGHEVVGVRQHYLNLDGIRTWRHQADLGFRYDTSLGSATQYGFEHGYDLFRPFDDDFVVFPLTAMEDALPDPGRDFDAAAAACDDLLEEAAANDAVMTVLWHPRFFCVEEFPGYRRLYRYLVEGALERDAWVGAPRGYLDELGPNPVGDAERVPSAELVGRG